MSEAPGPPPVIHPPTIPYAVAPPPRPPVWPKVIGILCIIFGAYGITGGAWGIVSPWVMAVFEKFIPKGQPNPLASFAGFGTWIIIQSIAHIGVSVILVFAGVRTLTRRASARTLVIAYAFVGIALSFVQGIFSYLLQTKLFQDPAFARSMPINANFLVGMNAFSAVLTAIFGCFWPVFLLIWFARARVKQEIANWP